ncbi:hypothetical protein [Catenulispora pinisilvae]|uniref:hypothetical protein n=1 Tax=Catenulispora pinisilvae TaxID=2705253 RepID=UPI0018921EF7|nr:hypothetical protein [Catenulispora pinisilvae]
MTPTPPGAADNQELVEKRLDLVRKGGQTAETTRVEWRGRPVDLPVITMPVNDLYYNPATHRIGAQRAHDPARDVALTSDPWSEQSQLYLHQLLQNKPSNPDELDPEFTALMEDLQYRGQNDPALITPSGILVNGNTRRAALKELRQQNIRVGVLPEDWDWTDVAAVELSLQLRKEHRRDYSYINEIITIAEEVSNGRSIEEIARAFGKQAKTIKQSLWVLATIDNAVARSEVTLSDGTVARMRRMDFEGHQETLREIYVKYTGMKASYPDQAERRLEASVMAVLSDQAKTAIRAIWAVERDFDDAYLEPALPEDFVSGTGGTGGIDIPGLDITLDADDAKVERARSRTDVILHAKAMSTAADKLTPREVTKTSALLTETKMAVTESLRKAQRDVSFTQRKLAAADRLAEATDIIETCIDDIGKARSLNVMDHDVLDESLEALREVIVRLATAASRGVAEPGKGLSWLQQAARVRS